MPILKYVRNQSYSMSVRLKTVLFAIHLNVLDVRSIIIWMVTIVLNNSVLLITVPYANQEQLINVKDVKILLWSTKILSNVHKYKHVMLIIAKHVLLEMLQLVLNVN
jgi:hypothetical protein